MNGFEEIFQNKILIVAIFAWAVAQALKVLFAFISTKKIVLELLVSSGGMPSSHSAFVTSLTAMVGFCEGFTSPLFAVSFMMSAIVMYDAAGVRRAAGQHAMVLNQLVKQSVNEDPADKIDLILKELLGHTPLQVTMGALLGVFIPIIFSL